MSTVFREENHKSWGNNIEWFTDPHDVTVGRIRKRTITVGKVVGWLRTKPKAGDLLSCPMQSGRTALFEFTDVEPQYNVPDMFFADVEFRKYEDEE